MLGPLREELAHSDARLVINMSGKGREEIERVSEQVLELAETWAGVAGPVVSADFGREVVEVDFTCVPLIEPRGVTLYTSGELAPMRQILESLARGDGHSCERDENGWCQCDSGKAAREALTIIGQAGVKMEEAVERGAPVLYEEARAGALHLEAETALRPEVRRILRVAVIAREPRS